MSESNCTAKSQKRKPAVPLKVRKEVVSLIDEINVDLDHIFDVAAGKIKPRYSFRDDIVTYIGHMNTLLNSIELAVYPGTKRVIHE